MASLCSPTTYCMAAGTCRGFHRHRVPPWRAHRFRLGSSSGVSDTEVEEPRCARQSRERKRAVAGTTSEIAGCDPSPPTALLRSRLCLTYSYARILSIGRCFEESPTLRRAPIPRYHGNEALLSLGRLITKSSSPGMVLITGASGRIARRTAEFLASDGHRLRLMSRNPRQAPKLPGVETVRGDFAELATLNDAFAGVSEIGREHV